MVKPIKKPENKQVPRFFGGKYQLKTAAKDHVCFGCGNSILKGTEYLSVETRGRRLGTSQKVEFITNKGCSPCARIFWQLIKNFK